MVDENTFLAPLSKIEKSGSKYRSPFRKPVLFNECSSADIGRLPLAPPLKVTLNNFREPSQDVRISGFANPQVRKRLLTTLPQGEAWETDDAKRLGS